ncbi:hypothetical protein SELMODRAFT_432049 [Selaginella moellendorffii]|uniref:Uncharacterized protein n=1 Tax=Selaginella moellendorffii TaxID=88036 RepID=D8TET8_SELML|nr:hypothetical protein SELMODRAFT_432049 [Selaginella moellendorffii]
MGWASSVDSDASGPWPPSAASGLYLKEVAPSHSYGIKNGSYKTSNNEYGRFYNRHETPPTKKGPDNYWSRKCDLLHRCNMNCFQQLRKFYLGHWPGFTDDFLITSNYSSAKNREWLEHKIPWRTNTESWQKSSSKRSRNRFPQDSWKPPEIRLLDRLGLICPLLLKAVLHALLGVYCQNTRKGKHEEPDIFLELSVNMKNKVPWDLQAAATRARYFEIPSRVLLLEDSTVMVVMLPKMKKLVLDQLIDSSR